MADRYITPEIETDPDAIAQIGFDFVATLYPGWGPTPGDPMTISIEVHARMIAERTDVDALVPTAIFRYYGASLFGLPPVDAVAAGGEVTITAIDDAGYTIPAGTQMSIASLPAPVGFETVEDAVIAPGDTEIAGVAIVALTDGLVGNDLTVDPQPVDTLDFIQGIALDDATSGGTDAEEDGEYLGRLSRELELAAPRPILPRDFAVFAERHPLVERSVALDGYNPDDGTWNNERFITTAIVGPSGANPSTGTKNEVRADLDARRETTFENRVIGPTFTAVDIDYAGVCLPGFDPASVQAVADAALAAYLAPGQWGQPQSGDRIAWLNQPVVRYLEVAAVLDRVEGWDYTTSLSLDGGDPGDDMALPGVAPLTQPGTITGSVTAAP